MGVRTSTPSSETKTLPTWKSVFGALGSVLEIYFRQLFHKSSYLIQNYTVPWEHGVLRKV
jgi:hypothetical protein